MLSTAQRLPPILGQRPTSGAILRAQVRSAQLTAAAGEPVSVRPTLPIIGHGQQLAERRRVAAVIARQDALALPEDRITRQQQRAWAVKEAKRRNKKLVADDRAQQLAVYRGSEGTKILRSQEEGREKFRAARRTPSRVGTPPAEINATGVYLNSHARSMAALKKVALITSGVDIAAAKPKAPRKSRAKVKSTETI